MVSAISSSSFTCLYHPLNSFSSKLSRAKRVLFRKYPWGSTLAMPWCSHGYILTWALTLLPRLLSYNCRVSSSPGKSKSSIQQMGLSFSSSSLHLWDLYGLAIGLYPSNATIIVLDVVVQRDISILKILSTLTCSQTPVFTLSGAERCVPKEDLTSDKTFIYTQDIWPRLNTPPWSISDLAQFIKFLNFN